MALEERVNKEMKTSKQIMIQAYLTADNKPTCCQDYKELKTKLVLITVQTFTYDLTLQRKTF